MLARSLWVEADAMNCSLWDGDETVAICCASFVFSPFMKQLPWRSLCNVICKETAFKSVEGRKKENTRKTGNEH